MFCCHELATMLCPVDREPGQLRRPILPAWRARERLRCPSVPSSSQGDMQTLPLDGPVSGPNQSGHRGHRGFEGVNVMEMGQNGIVGEVAELSVGSRNLAEVQSASHASPQDKEGRAKKRSTVLRSLSCSSVRMPSRCPSCSLSKCCVSMGVRRASVETFAARMSGVIGRYLAQLGRRATST